MKQRLILSVLTMLGFSGCSKFIDQFVDGPCMYGVPIIDYHYMGEVTDAEGNPIKGIEVKINTADGAIVTDDKGAFETDASAYVSETHTAEFTDVDGAENGGEFATKLVVIDKESERVDNKNIFDLGTIELEAKEE